MRYSLLAIAVLLSMTMITGCEDPVAMEKQTERESLTQLQEKLASLSKYVEAELSKSMKSDLKSATGTKQVYPIGRKYASSIPLQLEKENDSVIRVLGDIESKHRPELAAIIQELNSEKDSAGSDHISWVELMIAEANQLMALYDFRKAVHSLAKLQLQYVPIQSNYFTLGMTSDRALWHKQDDDAPLKGLIASLDAVGRQKSSIEAEIQKATDEIKIIDEKISQHQSARDQAIEKATDAKNQASGSTGEKYTELMRVAIDQERIAARETGMAEKWLAQKTVEDEKKSILEGELSIRQTEYDKVESDIAGMTKEINFNKQIFNKSLEQVNAAKAQLTENMGKLNGQFDYVMSLFDQSIQNAETAIGHFDASFKTRVVGSGGSGKLAISNTKAGAEAVLLGIRSQKATAMGRHATFLNMRAELGEKWGVAAAAEWKQKAKECRETESQMIKDASELVTRIQETASQLPPKVNVNYFLTEADVTDIRRRINMQLRSQQTAEMDTEGELRQALSGAGVRSLGQPVEVSEPVEIAPEAAIDPFS